MKRPKWAQNLLPHQWRHLCETYYRPTLKALEQDAATCRDCARIFARVQGDLAARKACVKIFARSQGETQLP